jgi:regulator of replication initiation timing
MEIERLQSVVDEVSELRMRHAASVHKNEECEAQNEAIKKRFVEKNTDSKSLAQDKEGLEQYLQGVQERNKKLQAENKYLKSKTKESVQAKRDAETALSALKKENSRLSKEFAKAKQNLLLLQKSENVCPEENPFPKLLMREEK